MQKLILFGLLIVSAFSSFSQNQIKQYEYWFDNNYQNKIAADFNPSTSFTFNALVSTSDLPEGLHTFRIRFQDVSGMWSPTENHFFNKMPSFSNNHITNYEYWFDNDYLGKKGETLTGKDSISLNSAIATRDLPEGLHVFQVRFQDKTGAWGSVSSQFFTKQSIILPIGENKIMAYRYWLDKDFAKHTNVTVDPANPLFLSTINIPAPGTATPEKYEFYPDPIGGHKITYHSQFCLNVQFKDKIDQWSLVSMDSVLHPYSVNILCETLLSGVPKVKDYPKNDTIHFFVDEAIAGDSLIFKSDKSLTIDLFDPAGNQIKTIPKYASTSENNGFHAQLDGEYYALVHGFGEATDSYALNYLRFPKFCVLNYNRSVVGNNGTDTIIFKGNGFSKNTVFTLISGGNTVVGKTLFSNYLTTNKAVFSFKNAPIGQYDIQVNYGDTTIFIEKGLEVVNSLTHKVLFGEVSMPAKGNYPFAGVYEYDNLIIDDGTTLFSYGISQLVLIVKGTLKIGKEVAIRVRNGYYAEAPKNTTSSISEENINSFVSSTGEGYSLYANTFGKGGDGGDGAHGGMGKDLLIPLGWGEYTTLPGNGGSGGGGGGGGFGGGKGGYRGILGVGSGGNGVYGGIGNDNGGSGGFGGNNPSESVAGGGALGVAANQSHSTTGFGAGGLGGGGNGGDGAIFGSASGGNGFGGPGGGGGGYGGGILVISASTIVCDPISEPKFLALGQTGGKGGIGLLSVTDGEDGEKGEDGLVIINCNNQVPGFIFSIDAYGSQPSSGIGGHGLVSGTSKVLINGNEIETAIGNVSSKGYGDERLTIYPNPTTGQITIETLTFEEGILVIRSIDGNTIFGPRSFYGYEKVDLSGISKGVYIVTVKSLKKAYFGKIVVR